VTPSAAAVGPLQRHIAAGGVTLAMHVAFGRAILRFSPVASKTSSDRKSLRLLVAIQKKLAFFVVLKSYFKGAM
jgi:hypothetical protein